MVNVIKNIVVPGKPAVAAGLAVPPFTQIHLHSTGNPNATNANSISYLSRTYNNAYYTHIVGEGQAIQVAATNGGGYDLGGSWNWYGYASIEFNEHVGSQAEFNRDYKIYIELARQLAREAGIKDFTLDTASTTGIKTHNYCSRTGHGSDHVDPLPFLQKWGISYAQLKHDIKYGVGDVVTPAADKGNGQTVFEKNGVWYTDKKFTKKANGKIKHMGQYWTFKDGKITQKPAKKSAASSAIQQFKNAGGAFTATKAFRVDAIKQVNGIWQLVNYDLAGGKKFNWTNNGVPLAIVDNVTRGNSAPTKVGDKVKFMKGYDSGTIDSYDNASNGVGIKEGKYGMVWYNANALLRL